ncbi:MAG: sel1 repeat family protein [Selenomonadaceae bacterium]|nr:sel1 repeat family protein [Selenomonadaceae bacterium]
MNSTSKGYGTLYTFFEDEERMKYYRQAAAHGNLTAMKELAYFLRYGKGIEQNCRESFQWYLRAASFYDVDAIFTVAEMYAAEIGTAQNLPKSLELYKKIANSNLFEKIDRKFAAKKIAYIYEKFFNDGRMMIKWLKKSALLGDTDARFFIAEIYRDGKFIESSGEDALKWFTAILNDKNLSNEERYSAAFEIAQMFHKGKAVARSDTEAVKYFKLSTKANIVIARRAYNTLAQIYCTSKEIAPNIGMVLHWLKKAIDVGSRQAMWIATKIYRDGKFGVRQNGEKALAILFESAEQNFDTVNKVSAMRMIAEMYDKGLAVPEDKQKAVKLYQEADLISSEWIQAINNLQLQV